jgi:uncharacterized protein (TIGR03083 family)
MDTERHLEALTAEGALLAETAQHSGLDAPVPSCPGWQVRDLLSHLGFIHRWATTIVSERLAGPPERLSEADVLAAGPGDDDMLGWFRDGHQSLVTALRSAPGSLECWAFLPAPSPRAFWARRQAHETAMHRADAQLVSGTVGPFDPAFAADGVDELVISFTPTPRSKARTPAQRTLLVGATDTGDAWRIRFGPEGVETERGDGPADGTLTAPASDLYLALWNRPPTAEPAVGGDTGLVDLWHENLRVRW